MGSNPRMVKELDLAQRHFKCTVLCFRLGNWSDVLDVDIAQRYSNVSFIYINADRSSLWQWLSSTIVERVATEFNRFFPSNLLLNALAHSKRSWLLLSRLRSMSEHDLVIAHNLAALYPAYTYSKRLGIKFAFDIEDYHPGEFTGNDYKNKTECDRRIFLIKKMLPHAYYLSAASELIGEYTLYDACMSCKGEASYIHIPNCFSSLEFIPPKSAEQDLKVKIVWFSQYITSDRGLEELFAALSGLQMELELHLIGSLKAHFKPVIKRSGIVVYLYDSMPQQLLHKFLANFDVGLALEMSSVDTNKELAVSNKIYAYAQAGNFIIATDTKGQTQFMNNFPWSGILVPQTIDGIRHALSHIIMNKDLIRDKAHIRYEKAKQMAWENESSKLLKLWS